MSIIDLLKKVISEGATDMHITVGAHPLMRVNGSLRTMSEGIIDQQTAEDLVRELLDEAQLDTVNTKGQIYKSCSYTGLGRFRVSAYVQRGSFAISVKAVERNIPSIAELGLPSVIRDLAMKRSGLILITGPAGSGKSTTLAAMINYINNNRRAHILTIEDPIEYLHKHNKSIINQRELGNDTLTFGEAIRSCLRQDPDVIMVSEMSDIQTMAMVLTAAEMGRLVISTMHTTGATNTINRIVDAFPSHQQQQIRVQLATTMECIISQQLLPKEDGNGRVAALEVMVSTPEIRNLIREGKSFLIESAIQKGAKFGMKTMDYSLYELYRQGHISEENALTYSVEHDIMEKYLGHMPII